MLLVDCNMNCWAERRKEGRVPGGREGGGIEGELTVHHAKLAES